tara:strand:+ start:258 stop:1445 length:1188 start_codon:yes stop_codon:yes gene_type:complete
MKILIEYADCWQTSFLEPCKSNEKKMERKFVATFLKRGEKNTPITKSTVMGVLNRLVGEQRKLEQVRKDKANYYFSEIEKVITFSLNGSETSTKELVRLTNKSNNRPAKSTYLGVLSDDNPWFFSDVSKKLWSVLFLDTPGLFDFILGKPLVDFNVDCYPNNLRSRIDVICGNKNDAGVVFKSIERRHRDIKYRVDKKALSIDIFMKKAASKPPITAEKKEIYQRKLRQQEQEALDLNAELELLKTDTETLAFERKLQSVVKVLAKRYPDCEYWKNGCIYPMSLYAAALYIQGENLRRDGLNVGFLVNPKGLVKIQGFSPRGFNGVRDWLNPMTGRRKIAVGSPCSIRKQSGKLQIDIPLDEDKAIDLKSKIDCAGVSSFYLGKKGLAYVSQITI